MCVFITSETFEDATYNYDGLLLDGKFYIFGGGSILGTSQPVGAFQCHTLTGTQLFTTMGGA